MYDLEPTDEQLAMLRFIRNNGEFAARITAEAYYRQISGRPIKGAQLFQELLDSVERDGLIEHNKAERGTPAKYYLTPKSLRLLGE
ncbi:MAG TPA: hypothetical protein VGY55_15165 [Pirellulales bacterium]|jgi:hypothetical protein|nr:hypothetical protein [Pirellulales bacterium]